MLYAALAYLPISELASHAGELNSKPICGPPPERAFEFILRRVSTGGRRNGRRRSAWLLTEKHLCNFIEGLFIFSTFLYRTGTIVRNER